ncbi:YciI family protein [Kribbella sp.]|uniref:YciI family protein n=1 Tax=Kribbella sp. TaxID=1871183 RepID=UPI002D2CC370|nr:YciI family protein [Kribbella sp.]HZX09272.1 YciI family protein [Kribbella sp.]
MKYLLIMNVNAEILEALPEAEQQAIGAGHQKFMDTIKASGEFHSTVALKAPAETAVVKVRNGVPAVTDGPFVESKEFLGGFYLIDVASRERAYELAAMIPDAGIEGLGVEIREVMFADGL